MSDLRKNATIWFISPTTTAHCRCRTLSNKAEQLCTMSCATVTSQVQVKGLLVLYHCSSTQFVSERRVPQSVSIFSCCATKKTENRAHTGDPSVPAAPSRDPVSQLHFAVSLLEKNVKRNIRVIHNVTSRPSRTSERLQR